MAIDLNKKMIIEILILSFSCLFLFFFIVISHECIHKAIFENYGVPAKIKFNFLKAETIGDEQAIEQLDISEYRDMQIMHALVEIITFILLSIFVIAVILILIIKFIS
ncbi:MAG: hypothetical protein QXS37_03865 [Candidatus Aenigmatarchaeota archaeon]